MLTPSPTMRRASIRGCRVRSATIEPCLRKMPIGLPRGSAESRAGELAHEQTPHSRYPRLPRADLCTGIYLAPGAVQGILRVTGDLSSRRHHSPRLLLHAGSVCNVCLDLRTHVRAGG